MARFTALGWLLRPQRRTYAAAAVAVYAVVVLVVVTITALAGSLWNAPGGGGGVGRLLATALAVTLVGPVVATCRVAARLSQRQRRELLSTLRLLGGSSAFLRSLSLIGELTTVAVGAALGSGIVLGSALIRRAWAPESALPVRSILLTVAGVAVVAALNSVGDLRAVLASPLSVRMRSNAASVRTCRLVAGVILFAAAMLLLRTVSPEWGPIAAVAAVTVATLAVNAVLGLLGPWVVARLASHRLQRAGSAAGLIAMRDILESPAAAWRQVSTLALMSFLIVPVGALLAYLSLIQRTGPGLDARSVLDFEAVRTAILAAMEATLALTITAIGAGQGAAIEERRERHIALSRIGMSSRLIAQARRRAVTLPLDVAVLGSAALSAVFFWWLVVAGAASMSPHLPAVGLGLLGSILVVRLVLYGTVFPIRRQLRPGTVPDEDIGAPGWRAVLR